MRKCKSFFHPGVAIYKSYRYVPPQRIIYVFLRRFGLRAGIDFVHFCLEFGYGFRGNYARVYECFCCFNIWRSNPRENDLDYSILSNLSNEDIINGFHVRSVSVTSACVFLGVFFLWLFVDCKVSDTPLES